MERRWRQPVLTGAVTAFSGFAGTAAVVLAGLTAAGASTAQAATGLVALCLTQGAGTLWLSRRYRQPITLAWSTPGAAFLVSAGPITGGWPAAAGAFVVAALLGALVAASAKLSRLVARIPPTLAQAMLAGIVLPICVQAASSAARSPLLALPVVAVWFVLLRIAPRWATAGAFAAVLIAIGVVLATRGQAAPVVPTPVFTMPEFSVPVLIGVALPLAVITMAAQNVPGAAVLAAHGYTVPWRPALLVSAGGSLIGAPLGGHAINLAAITAALPASSAAHPDPRYRWIASATCGSLYLGLGAVAPLLAAVLTGSIAGVVQVVAGLALLPTLLSSLAAVMAEGRERLPAGLTVVTGASTLTIAGVGPAVWSILVGGICWAWLRAGRPDDLSSTTGPA